MDVGTSNRSKILVVTHKNIMEALTADSVRHDSAKEKSVFSPYYLAGGQKFEPYELFPYHI